MLLSALLLSSLSSSSSPSLIMDSVQPGPAMVSVPVHRLVGLVVKVSASRAEDPGFESRLRRDFFGVESY